MTAAPTTPNPRHYRTVVDAPIGPVVLVATDAALRRIGWHDESGAHREKGIDDVVDVDGPDEHPILARTATQLAEYFAGDRTTFDLPLDPEGTEFQLEAWQALRAIPFGETRSYRDQATTIGRPTAVRAIGAANGRNPIPIVVPCHRVVGADGSLTGFAGGVETKAWLLDHEARHSGLFAAR